MNKISLFPFSRFCALNPNDHYAHVRAMILASKKKGGMNYWSPSIAAYRRWLERPTEPAEFLSAQRLDKDRASVTRRLIAGDRLVGSQIVFVKHFHWNRNGFRLCVTPDVFATFEGRRIAVKFFISKDRETAEDFGQLAADTLMLGFRGTPLEGALPVVVDVMNARLYYPSTDAAFAEARIRGQLGLLRELWDAISNQEAA